MSNKHIKLYEGWLEDIGSTIKSWFAGGEDDSPSTAAPTSNSPRSTAMSSEFMQDTKASIKDISDLSIAPRDKPMSNTRKYFIIHHTAGHSTAEGVVNVLNTRRDKKTKKLLKLAVQWVVDRNGKIYRTFPEGLSAGHAGVKEGRRRAGGPPDQQNHNSQGVEVVANNDKDILPVQAEAVRRLIKYLGFKLENVYGHGEVTLDKEPDEGATIKKWVTKYWNEPFLPVQDTIEQLKDVTSFNDPAVQQFVTSLNKPSSNSNLT